MSKSQHTVDAFPMIDDGQNFGPKCLECGKHESNLVGGRVIYPHRPDLYKKDFWLCACGAYCGCHVSTKEPLGFPCGPKTRKARQEVHAVLDPLWKNASKGQKRRRGFIYEYLAREMGLPRDATHTAMFGVAQCEEALRFLRVYDPTKHNIGNYSFKPKADK